MTPKRYMQERTCHILKVSHSTPKHLFKKKTKKHVYKANITNAIIFKIFFIFLQEPPAKKKKRLYQALILCQNWKTKHRKATGNGTDNTSLFLPFISNNQYKCLLTFCY